METRQAIDAIRMPAPEGRPHRPSSFRGRFPVEYIAATPRRARPSRGGTPRGGLAGATFQPETDPTGPHGPFR